MRNKSRNPRIIATICLTLLCGCNQTRYVPKSVRKLDPAETAQVKTTARVVSGLKIDNATVPGQWWTSSDKFTIYLVPGEHEFQKETRKGTKKERVWRNAGDTVRSNWGTYLVTRCLFGKREKSKNVY